jgi:hypothetical protein
MAARDPVSIDLVHDASWLAHRYDPIQDAVHFLNVPRDTHRGATFLTDEYLGECGPPTVLARKPALAAMPSRAPIHFIFHSAYCCSTLLARAFDAEGISMGLKEPVILNDLSGWRQRGADRARLAEVLDSALTLLARPFAPGEAVVVKPSNLINPFATAMLAMRPEAKALLLYAPLPLYLGSIAKKGMWGRLWVRELFVKLGRDGFTDYGFSADDILGQTDLQIAAIGWIAQHRLFAALAQRFPDRVRTLDSETLLARSGDVVLALAKHYQLAIDDGMAAEIVQGDAFTRHSKGGERFGREQRQAEQRAAAEVHAEEIEKVMIWAKAVAESAGQSLALPACLLD